MKVLIINMVTAKDRMAFMAAQMDHFGLDWARIEAITPDTLTPPADDPVWHRWQRPLRVTEMALCTSHMAAWRAVIAADVPHLILEDDATLAADLPAFLADVDGLTDVDHISLETRGRKKVLGRVLHSAAPMLRLWQDRTGSAAYIAYPKGAKLMLDHALRVGGPSDAIISSTYGMRSYQAVPALAVQLDICAQYGVPQALKTRSLIDAIEKPRLPVSGKAALGFRTRRIWGQIVMAWRQLRHRGTRLHVAPARDWPKITL